MLIWVRRVLGLVTAPASCLGARLGCLLTGHETWWERDTHGRRVLICQRCGAVSGALEVCDTTPRRHFAGDRRRHRLINPNLARVLRMRIRR